jgi:isoleucyl-tRNA synthetase
MSKSKGNAVDPFDALKAHGADAIRWYFYSNGAPWLPSRFSDKAVREGQRKFMGTLWNTYAFYVLYANIDEFDPTKHELDTASLTQMDRWILSKLNTVVGNHVKMYDSEKCIVNMPRNKVVVIQGLEDYIVVENNDMLLICKKSEEQQIRQYVTDIQVDFGKEFV